VESDERLMIAPEEGTSVLPGGLGAIHKLFGSDTGGSFSIVEHPLQPGILGAPPHTHQNEDEYSFVLEGEVGVLIGQKEFTATPGTYIVKPRGIPHAFWNAGSEPARILEIISPAGFEKYFDELGEVISAAGSGEPDFAKIMEIAGRYGLTMYMERMPELMEKYNLRLE
jgi:quercetin dioxygenase-like cupin family protein